MAKDDEPDAGSWVLTGFCRDGNPERCPGALLSTKERLVFCTGETHQGEDYKFTKCLLCKSDEQEIREIQAHRAGTLIYYTGLTCLDIDGCIERQRVNTDRAIQRLEARTGIKIPALQFDAAGRPLARPRSRGPSRPTSGRCVHCGAPTRGGQFVPGHDAKLKSLLAADPNPEALAERVIRGWATAAERERAEAEIPSLLALGTALITTRNQERLDNAEEVQLESAAT